MRLSDNALDRVASEETCQFTAVSPRHGLHDGGMRFGCIEPSVRWCGRRPLRDPSGLPMRIVVIAGIIMLAIATVAIWGIVVLISECFEVEGESDD